MRKLLAAALASAVLGIACDNSGGSTTTSPSLVALTTETFSGSVEPGGSSGVSVMFTAAQTGEIDITLTATR